jgi:hypothetical protein
MRTGRRGRAESLPARHLLSGVLVAPCCAKNVQGVVNGRRETFVVGCAGFAGNTGYIAWKCRRFDKKERESIPERSGEETVAQNRGT